MLWKTSCPRANWHVHCDVALPCAMQNELSADAEALIANGVKAVVPCILHGSGNGHVDYVQGANIAGFIKVADAMLAYGAV